MSTETTPVAPALSDLPVGPGVPQGPAAGVRQLVGADGKPVQPIVPPAPKVVADKEPSIEDLIAVAEKMDDSALAGGATGVAWEKTLQALPEDARKLLGNMRADYTKKTQALAESTRRMESERTALTNSEAYKKLKELAEKETGEFDPYSPDSFLVKIKQEVSQQMLAALRPVVERQEEDEARASVHNFMTAHPDLKEPTMKRAVAKELQANESLQFEQAYFIVRGKMDATRVAKMETELGQYRKAAQAAGLRVATGTRPNELRPPANVKGGAAILAWLRSQQRG